MLQFAAVNVESKIEADRELQELIVQLKQRVEKDLEEYLSVATSLNLGYKLTVPENNLLCALFLSDEPVTCDVTYNGKCTVEFRVDMLGLGESWVIMTERQ